MDLSRLKWPLIILAVVGIGWLASSGGVNWMVTNYTRATPDQDVKRDITDEAGLTRVGGYLMCLFKYQKAEYVMNLALQRYGTNGKNHHYNRYRIAKCLEKQGRFQESYKILSELEAYNARQYDDRIPDAKVLRTRAAKLKAVNNL